MKNKSYILAIPLMTLSLALGLWGYLRAEGEVITVCVKKGGAMYMIGEGFKKTECAKNDKLVSWNIQGQPGPSADILHLFDGNGNDLGILLDAELYGANPRNLKLYTTYSPSIDAVTIFDANSSLQTVTLALLQGRVVFEGDDCTGLAFSLDRLENFQRPFASPNMLIKTTGPRYFVVSASTPSPRVGNSYISILGDPCMNEATSTPSAYSLEEVNLPFPDPPAWPLEIREQ